MATTTLLCGIALACAVGCGAFAFRALATWARRQKMRSNTIPQDPEAAGSSLLSTGFAPLMPLARRLARNPKIRATAAMVQRNLLKSDAGTPVETFLSGAMAICLAVFAVVSVLFQTAFLGVLAAAGIVVAAIAKAASASRKANEQIRDHIPDALTSMNRCFQAGMTAQQTFDLLAAGEHGPLCPMFNQVGNSLRTGESMGSALNALRKHDYVPELVFLAAALEIQHQTGGSMKPVLNAVTQTIRNKIDLARKLKSQTAQAQLSAKVVGAMPFILLAILSLISRDFLAPFFQSTAGLAVLALALLLQIAGVLAIRSLLKVSVQA